MKNLVILSIIASSLLAGGEVIFIEKDVLLKRDGKEQKAKLNEEVKSGDTIITGSDSKVKLKFEDGTTFFIGKDSSFEIDEYVMEEGKNSAKFSMDKGVFRFVTGKISTIAPEKFALKTKTATIGIRGTHVGGFIEHNKSDVIYIGEGKGVILQSELGKRELLNSGEGAVFEEGKEPSKVIMWKKEKVDKLFSLTE